MVARGGGLDNGTMVDQRYLVGCVSNSGSCVQSTIGVCCDKLCLVVHPTCMFDTHRTSTSKMSRFVCGGNDGMIR